LEEEFLKLHVSILSVLLCTIAQATAPSKSAFCLGVVEAMSHTFTQTGEWASLGSEPAAELAARAHHRLNPRSYEAKMLADAIDAFSGDQIPQSHKVAVTIEGAEAIRFAGRLGPGVKWAHDLVGYGDSALGDGLGVGGVLVLGCVAGIGKGIYDFCGLSSHPPDMSSSEALILAGVGAIGGLVFGHGTYERLAYAARPQPRAARSIEIADRFSEVPHSSTALVLAGEATVRPESIPPFVQSLQNATWRYKVPSAINNTDYHPIRLAYPLIPRARHQLRYALAIYHEPSSSDSEEVVVGPPDSYKDYRAMIWFWGAP
jgi:hypothetical protein